MVVERDIFSKLSLPNDAKKLAGPLVIIALIFSSAFLAYPFFSAKLSFVQGSSTPLLPFMVEVVAGAFRVTLAQATKAVILAFYMLAPLSLFLFSRYFTGSLLFSSVASFSYLFPSLITLLIPSWRVVINEGWFVPPQAAALLSGGDATHIVGLFFLPLGGMFLLRFLRLGNQRDLFWGVFLATLLALTSRAALWTFFIFSFVFVISEALLSRRGLKIKRFLLFTVFLIGIVSFWYTPLFWSATFDMVYEMGILRGFGVLLPLTFIFLPGLGAAIFLLCDQKPRRRVPLVIGLLLLIFGGIVFAGEFGLSLAPGPSRYLLELKLATSLFWGYAAVLGLRTFLRRKLQKDGSLDYERIAWLAFLVTASVLVLLVFFSRILIDYSLFKMNLSGFYETSAKILLPSIAERPLWDLGLGLLASFASLITLLYILIKPSHLKRLHTFLPRFLKNVGED